MRNHRVCDYCTCGLAERLDGGFLGCAFGRMDVISVSFLTTLVNPNVSNNVFGCLMVSHDTFSGLDSFFVTTTFGVSTTFIFAMRVFFDFRGKPKQTILI